MVMWEGRLCGKGPLPFPGNWLVKQFWWEKTKKKKISLTDTRNQIIKSFLRKEGVFQPTEIELQDTSDRVNVMVTLIISQRVFT